MALHRIKNYFLHKYALVSENKKGVRIEIQPRFKIQYPMKNQYNNNALSL